MLREYDYKNIVHKFKSYNIYKIEDEDGDVYIGHTSMLLSLRKALHKSENKRFKNGLVSRATRSNQLGNEQTFELLECMNTNNLIDVLKLEQKWINFYGDKCVNKQTPFDESAKQCYCCGVSVKGWTNHKLTKKHKLNWRINEIDYSKIDKEFVNTYF